MQEISNRVVQLVDAAEEPVELDSLARGCTSRYFVGNEEQTHRYFVIDTVVNVMGLVGVEC